jgi:hypothetical protein
MVHDGFMDENDGDLFSGVINKIIFDPDFNEKIESLRKINPNLGEPLIGRIRYDLFTSESGGKLYIPEGGITKHEMDPKKGRVMIENHKISAYDESIAKYAALEGTADLTSHSLITLSNDVYIPLNLITFNFYTRSTMVSKISPKCRFSEQPEMDSQIDRVKDKINFLTKYCPPGSLVLIDGPLIAGDVYTHMIRAIEKFHERDIIPIFFVKNSSSNLVIDNTELKGQYNSDLHWANSYLAPGQRTCFFKYQDLIEARNSKVFFYIKAFKSSPQRVEIHSETYGRAKNLVEQIPDLIFYFICLQGNGINPQVRPIAIAEKYARETIRIVNFLKLMKEIGITPTINEERFNG